METQRPLQEKGRERHFRHRFDPGVVNAYAGARGPKSILTEIDTIDIMDVNAGKHGKYFARTSIRRFISGNFKKVWTWIDRKWVSRPVHSDKLTWDFPVVGEQTVYLTGHD